MPTSASISASQHSHDVGKVRSKSIAAFSAQKIVSDSKDESVYLPTLSERLDSAETGFGRISETPKRVSFNVGYNDDATKGKAASK